MELSEMNAIAEYHLLLFQPDPESGERICVGVALTDDLLYDADSSRAHHFAHSFPPQILNLYLKDIREKILRSRGDGIDSIIREYAPTFVVSSARKLMKSPDASTKLMLLERYVTKGEVNIPRVHAAREFSGKLKEFASRAIGPVAFGQLIENAGPLQIFGEKRRGLRRVPLAIRAQSRILLMDGLDLNVLDPPGVIQSSARVVHTFWQYGRAPKPYGEDLKRVAVIFNGKQSESPSYKDAHAFALDQFKKEADETIEASSALGEERLAGLLH